MKRASSERGAILIFVAISVFALTALSAFVLDFGVLWLSRREAQNAADAGALAGAITRAYDEPDAPGPLTLANATAAANANLILGTAGAPVVDASPGACPAYAPANARCVRVDVFRDGTNASAVLPTYFAQLLGIGSQGIRATATAQVRYGNSSDCLRPFAIPDYFSPTLADYDPPGYTVEEHLGEPLLLKGGPGTQYGPGWFRLIDFGSGAQAVSDAIRGCNGIKYGVGDDLPEENGNKASIRKAVEDLYNLDPDAEWDDDADKVINSCAETGSCMRYNEDGDLEPDPNRGYSPRIIALPVFDPVLYDSSGGETIRIVSIIGFFVTTQNPHPPDFDINGIIALDLGLDDGEAGEVDPEAGFLTTIRLIQ